MPAKSVKINTPEINQAIRTAVENAGGVEAFARSKINNCYQKIKKN